MGRADFACDVALCDFLHHYIYIYIYIPFRIYIFIIIITIMGLFSTTCQSCFHDLGYGRALISSGSSVTPRGFPLRILPSLGVREPPSPLASRRCSAAFFSPSSSSLRGSPPLSRRRRTTQPSLWIFHGLSRLIRFRFMTASSSRGLADVPCMSRRLLSSLVVIGPENLTRARLRHRPPYELRAYVNQYICKLFFCAFFLRCDPHFFIITLSLSLSSLTCQLITEHTLLDLLFNALVCVFLLHYLSFKFKIMVHVRGARAGASGILPSRAGICDLIAIGGGG